MKPYTLEWWLIRLQEASMLYKAELTNKAGIIEEMLRYMDLMRWIHRRIVRKYGERAE